MTIAIIDYGSGNLRSVSKSVEKSVNDLNLKKKVLVTNKPEDIKKSDRIILPGVGSFSDCMQGLQKISGLLEALYSSVCEQKKPFFGICVGMQLMSETSFENGKHKGFSWIPSEVIPIENKNKKLKIPHMGWNELKILQPDHYLLKNVSNNAHAYFVHSYFVTVKEDKCKLLEVEYGNQLTAAVVVENKFGTQFHPEKSQATGRSIINNFLTWRP